MSIRYVIGFLLAMLILGRFGGSHRQRQLESPSAGQQEAFTDRRKIAFDFARDSTKQLLTLATGILTVTIALTAAASASVPQEVKGILGAIWILYLLSVIFGAWTLLALTGTLEPRLGDKTKPTIRGFNVIFPTIMQVLAFLGGTIAAVVAGFKVL